MEFSKQNEKITKFCNCIQKMKFCNSIQKMKFCYCIQKMKFCNCIQKWNFVTVFTKYWKVRRTLHGERDPWHGFAKQQPEIRATSHKWVWYFVFVFRIYNVFLVLNSHSATVRRCCQQAREHVREDETSLSCFIMSVTRSPNAQNDECRFYYEKCCVESRMRPRKFGMCSVGF